MKKIITWSVIIVLLAIVGTIAKLAWYDRYYWPGTPDHMLDLPAEDRSQWPATAVTWSVETQAVEVATPDGNKVVPISYHTNSIGMDFVRIEPGSFSPQAGYRYTSGDIALRRAKHLREIKPPPLVTISKPYFLSAFEVTNAQFELFDPSHRQRRPDYQQGKRGDHHPVEPVTWQEANLYARWLSAKEGRQYRLPTEAEFEYATAAGTTTRLYWGNDFQDRNKANLGGLHSNRETYRLDGYKQTAPVGMFPANPWGLYDMIGNSYEWVADWWHPNLEEPATDPTGPATGKIRMGKGGGWTTRPYATFTGEDDGNNPADLGDSRGFRLLVELPR